MLRLWKESYTRPARLGIAASASAIAHVLTVAFWIVSTLPDGSMARDSIANRIFYIPPPDKPPRVAGGLSSIHYVSVAAGLGLGPGPIEFDAAKPAGAMEQSLSIGAPPDTAAQAAAVGAGEGSEDSVYTILEVDSTVMRAANSAAPAYPLELLKQNIEGSVRVRYVVDTTGLADPETLEVLLASHPLFAKSVREVLPYMRFQPAKIGTKKVRQWVEQPFTFHIARPAAKEKPSEPPAKDPDYSRSASPRAPSRAWRRSR
jgi:protein TonB